MIFMENSFDDNIRNSSFEKGMLLTLKRHFVMIIAVSVALSALLTTIVYYSCKPVYQAEAVLEIMPHTYYKGIGYYYDDVAKSSSVVMKCLRWSGMSSEIGYNDFVNMSVAKTAVDGNSISLTVRYSDKGKCIRMANSWAASLIDVGKTLFRVDLLRVVTNAGDNVHAVTISPLKYAIAFFLGGIYITWFSFYLYHRYHSLKTNDNNEQEKIS